MARFLKNRKNSQGEVPGKLIFIGKQKIEKPIIQVIRYNNTDFLEKELPSINEAVELIDSNQATWINIYGVHQTETIKELGDLLNISPLLLEDVVNTDQRPRYVEDENNIAVFLKNFISQDEKLYSDQLSFIMGKNYLITFQEQRGHFFDPVRERIRKNMGRIRNAQTDYLCFALLDIIIDNYMQHIEAIGDKIEKLEEILLTGKRKNIIEEIYKYKIEITYIRKTIRPVKEIMIQILKSGSGRIQKKTRDFFIELDDLVTHALEAVEIYYNMISDQLNIYHTNLSNKVNDVMKVLTIFASIFIPLTFIAGVYGTNFDNIPELHFKYGYYAMWGIIVIVALIMLIYFKRKKWL